MEGLLSRAVANSAATVACLDVATATAVGEAAKILASFGFVIALVLIAEALLAELSLYHAGMRYPSQIFYGRMSCFWISVAFSYCMMATLGSRMRLSWGIWRAILMVL